MTGAAEPDGAAGRVRLGRLAWLFPRNGEAETAGADPADEDLYRRIEELILGGPRRHTRAELVAEHGLNSAQVAGLWRSLGFPAVGDDDAVFTDGDRDALRGLLELRAAGLVPGEAEDAMARSVGQAMAGLADWQVEMLYQLVDYGRRPVSGPELLEIVERVLPVLESVQGYIWRRHVAAAASRMLSDLPELPDESQTCTLAVGFVDLVGFTRASRRLRPSELTALLDRFHRAATEVVATRRGRVVKTVGDEVLFVANEADDAVEIALGLIERVSGVDSLPRLRIGMALGEVVTRFGDVYGEVVNIAARLTTQAPPGRVLVDRNLSAALAGDPRYDLRPRRPVAVRGYRHLRQWELHRAAPAA